MTFVSKHQLGPIPKAPAASTAASLPPIAPPYASSDDYYDPDFHITQPSETAPVSAEDSAPTPFPDGHDPFLVDL